MPFIPSAALLSSPTVTLPWFNVQDYGATGDGVTDDMAACMSAIDACGAAGGGTVLFPYGNYRFATTYTTNSLGALLISYDNINLQLDPGARLFSELASQGVMAVAGNAKPTHTLPSGSVAGWYQHGSFFRIASATEGSMTITCSRVADAGYFAAGDVLYIRSGELITGQTPPSHFEPDAETVVVASADAGTGIITLREPLMKSYAQEYFPTTNTPTTTTTNLVANDTVIPVASTTGWSASDPITIIGTSTNPSHCSSVVSVQAGVSLTIKVGIEYAIPSGAAVHRGSGITTTGVTTALAVLGVRKVTDYTINNFSIRGSGIIENSYSTASTVWMNNVIGFVWSGVQMVHRSAGIVGNNLTNVDIAATTRGVPTSPTTGTYWFASGSGSKNVRLHDCYSTSAGFTGIVFSEGTYNGQAFDNTIYCAKNNVAGENPLCVQSRARATIGRNVVRGGGNDGIVFVALSCTIGGHVFDNDVSGNYSGWTYNIQPTGWSIDGHRQLAITYSASMTPDANADLNLIDIGDGSAFTINQPLNGAFGKQLTIRFRNRFGVPGAITWDSSIQTQGGAFTAPGVGGDRSLTFVYVDTNDKWIEISRNAADVF